MLIVIQHTSWFNKFTAILYFHTFISITSQFVNFDEVSVAADAAAAAAATAATAAAAATVAAASATAFYTLWS
jgi:hypothetical protein